MIVDSLTTVYFYILFSTLLLVWYNSVDGRKLKLDNLELGYVLIVCGFEIVDIISFVFNKKLERGVYDLFMPLVLVVLSLIDLGIKKYIWLIVLIALLAVMMNVSLFPQILYMVLIILTVWSGIVLSKAKYNVISLMTKLFLSLVFLNILIVSLLATRNIDWQSSQYIVYFDYYVKIVLIANLLILNAKSSRFINP